jgi:hypothetical protein
MTLAWLQLSYRQTKAYSFSTETAVAFITAKIVASLRDTACCHRNRRFHLQKAVTFYLCARTVYFSAIGTKAFCAWFVTFWPICKESQLQFAVFPSVLLAAALPSKLHVIQSHLRSTSARMVLPIRRPIKEVTESRTEQTKIFS